MKRTTERVRVDREEKIRGEGREEESRGEREKEKRIWWAEDMREKRGEILASLIKQIPKTLKKLFLSSLNASSVY